MSLFNIIDIFFSAMSFLTFYPTNCSLCKTQTMVLCRNLIYTCDKTGTKCSIHDVWTSKQIYFETLHEQANGLTSYQSAIIVVDLCAVNSVNSCGSVSFLFHVYGLPPLCCKQSFIDVSRTMYLDSLTFFCQISFTYLDYITFFSC